MASQLLRTLRTQLQCAEQDLQTELFLINREHEGQQDPFAALKCERLYRTIRALKLKIERLEQEEERPEAVSRSARVTFGMHRRSEDASIDESKRVGEERATMDEWNLVNSSHRDGAFSGLRLDPTVEPPSGKGQDHLLESWTWNGRPLRLVRKLEGIGFVVA